MQTAPQVIPIVPTNPDIDSQRRAFAHRLAKTHEIEISPLPTTNLLENLKSWELALQNAYARFKAIPSRNLPDFPANSSRAGEWVLDNFYVAKQAFRQIEKDLPGSFLKQLPKLHGTPLKGHARIFGIAWEWIGYCQSQIDLTETSAFVLDYQQVTPLAIGELWAAPIMLRIGILGRLVSAAAELTGIDVPQGMSIRNPYRETGEFSSFALPAETIVANCFLSLRLLSATDWKDFFEQTSRVEQILRSDPAGVYASMDFETRNSYRSVIEELAQHSKLSTPSGRRSDAVIGGRGWVEEQVAFAAIELAQLAGAKESERQAHVGFYLRGAGRVTLESSLRYQPGLSARIQRALLAVPTAVYLGSIAIFSALFVLGLLAYTWFSGGSFAQLLVAGLLGSGLAVESAISLVHWNVTHTIKPQSLPRMDFSKGIPAGNRTMVVVPTLLESAGELAHLLQELELYYLSNSDPLLTYALLTDFGDAPAPNMPDDEQLLALARTGVEDLNRKYAHGAKAMPAGDNQPFYLFHRQRQWNPSEGVWMGWERKRGKLADFNRLLLNLGDDYPDALRETAYTTQIGDTSIIAGVKYVITLDADTSLPQGSANRLIATLAHPLNHAEFAPDGRSVVAGYTVLQPRVAIKPTSANRSLFSQIYAGNAGFDLYSFAVSDVYQDLFGEGSYVGKGIYDVAAFERSLAGQVRQNTLLSHDLFEGIYGRAALVTDIMLYEEYPTRYLAYARRLGRWIRGDWQLLPWLLPFVRTKTGLTPNRLSTINLWKVFDNLRRSLLPPILLALLVAGWLFLPGSPLVWTLLVLLPAALPIAVQTVQQGKHHLRRLK